MKSFPLFLLLIYTATFTFSSCYGQTDNTKKKPATTAVKAPGNFKEGSDYVLFDRVRILDKTAFTKPEEAYSLLLPKGWQQQSNILWNAPGTACAGTFRQLNAMSADGKSAFVMYPDIIYSWNTNEQLMEFYRNNPSASPNCATAQPMDAEPYLRQVFAPNDLGNPEILSVTSNEFVVQEMQQSNEKSKLELMQYGASQVQFYQTAINANVRWQNGTEGLIVLGVTILENTVPNVYDGTSSKIYTTQVMKRTVYSYPAEDRQQAANQFCMIMGSIRTNPAWTDVVNKFWKDVRQQKQIAHVGRLQMMDAQTRAIGEKTIQNGAARLNNMDTEMRSWEQRQSSQDRVHTNFIKTIREVENYRDETGKIELTSGYDHAWSRSDGSSFIMSNSAGFDPGSVLQDQRWKEMKKVD